MDDGLNRRWSLSALDVGEVVVAVVVLVTVRLPCDCDTIAKGRIANYKVPKRVSSLTIAAQRDGQSAEKRFALALQGTS